MPRRFNKRDIERILTLEAAGHTYRQIAKEMDAAVSNIHDICTGKLYRKWTGREPKWPGYKRVFNQEQVEEILRLREEGVPYREVAARFGVSGGSITQIYRGISYRDWTGIDPPQKEEEEETDGITE